MANFLPTIGCLVKTSDDKLGRVRSLKNDSGKYFCHVEFADRTPPKTLSIYEVKNGFKKGQYVSHNPTDSISESLGIGQVQSVRKVADHEQLLVQFFLSNETSWLPFESLAHVHSTETSMSKGILGNVDDHAERFRLRTLAMVLKNWDQNTGGFARLDIDPLPHQIHVANKVVTSPKADWLIADDVGLGKTIEVGLILHALEQRGRCNRTLVVCPSGLVTQWKEEMRHKFDRKFEIYKRDFTPEYPEELRARDNVIVSLDLAKREDHLEMILQGGNWDVIVFDEAHRLGRSEKGERTERFKLAEALRPRARTFLLLTATPHQGKSLRFKALLELVRPDLQHKIATMEMNPEIVGEIVIRNRKTHVTDANGNLIFKGHDTHRISIEPSDDMRTFDTALQKYLRQGYKLSERGDRQARAIGFVMTTYRKLASSSLEAIGRALERRLANVIEGPDLDSNIIQAFPISDLEEDDGLTLLEKLDKAPEFFTGEAEMLQDLLKVNKLAQEFDSKSEKFIEDVVRPLRERDENLLIFTEYLATQEYLKTLIEQKFPDIGAISLINGGMKLEEKVSSVNDFNEKRTRLMISTEAGGEGINMHPSCHIMCNYDLPWNPSKLVQRIGRLYRYGQEKRVQVFNIQCDDGFDNQAINLMMNRVETIARDMAEVYYRDPETMKSDILGELLVHLDMEDILEKSKSRRLELTESEIDAAIKNAREARDAEQNILNYADSYSGVGTAAIDKRHMLSFVEGMLPYIGGTVRQRLHGGRLIEVELSEDAIGEIPGLGRKRIFRMTATSELARRFPAVESLDFQNTIVLALSKYAQKRQFEGRHAHITTLEKIDGIGIFHIRWQGLAGQILEEEVIPICYDGENISMMESKAFAQLLLTPLESSKLEDHRIKPDMIKKLRTEFEREVKRGSENGRVPGAFFLAAGALA